MSRKKSLLHKELDKRIIKAEDRGKQRYAVEDECAQTEMTEGHLESFRNRRIACVEVRRNQTSRSNWID